MRDFHMSRTEAWDELPIAQAQAYSAWNTEHGFMPVNREGDGYVAQEAANFSHG